MISTEKTIHMVMLTTSDSEADILESYTHHANSCISSSKLVDFPKYMEVVKSIKITG